jgi:hypothetical protein
LLFELALTLEQLLELDVVEVLELPGESAAVVQPQPHRLLQGAGDVQQGAVVIVADGQVQGAVQLTALAAAGGLAAGSGALDQAAAQEGLLGDQLGESGTGVTFGKRACGSLALGASSRF